MDKEAASLMGISVKKIYSYVWVMNAIFVGTIGILLAPSWEFTQPWDGISQSVRGCCDRRVYEPVGTIVGGSS